MLVRRVAAGAITVIVTVVGWVGGAGTASAAPGSPDAPATVPHPTCTRTWIGAAGGDWATDANWTPAGVPTSADVACVTGGRPVVATAARAGALVATDGARVELDDTLTLSSAEEPDHQVVGAVIVNSDVTGTGMVTFDATPSFLVSLTGVSLDGVQFELGPHGHVDIAGNRRLCGGSTALCLADGAALASQKDVSFTGPGDIRHLGTGTSLSSKGSLIIRTTSTSSTPLVDVPLDVNGVDAGSDLGGGPAKVTLTALSKLTADGTLEAKLWLEASGSTTLVIPRSIVTADANVVVTNGAHIVTPGGADAVATLTRVNDVEVFLGSATVTPAGGTLTNRGQLYVNDATVDGNIDNIGTNTPTGQARLQVNDTMTVTGTVTMRGNTVTTVASSLTAANVVVASGIVDISPAASLDLGPAGSGQLSLSGHATVRLHDNTSISGDVAQSGGTLELSTLPSSCLTAHIAGNYRATAVAEWALPVTPSLSCGPALAVSGSASLPREVLLSVRRPGLPLGTQRVLVDAQGGVSGTIRSVVATDTFGQETWEPTTMTRRAIVTKTSNS